MTNDTLSDEDKALFRETMKTVIPLSKLKEQHDDKLPKPLDSCKNTTFKTPAVSLSTPLSNYYHEAVQAESILSYLQHGIPPKRFRELKSGKIKWQDKLDLHGYTIDSAQEKLLAFLSGQLKCGNRCVLIIHGKGSINGEAPILKNLVKHWLQQIPQILAFHSALGQDGGTGALYVLLKKGKNQ